MRYRSDIQILRGIAVLYVVLFHLGFQAIQSGFLGVDVFFVISGFLMAVLYKKDDVKGFFVRRAKRLLPAYYVVIVGTLVVSFIINTPNETDQVVTQAMFGSVFLSNVGFWLQNSYFSKSEFNPLLHLWSLGVEIQFYLMVPIFAYIYEKIKFSLVAILLCSMALCFWMLTISPKTSFFMMPLRVWEFLLGYGCASYLTTRGSVKFLRLPQLGFIGLVLITLIPFLNVDGKVLDVVSGHPGLNSLLVSLATCMVLIFGLPSVVEKNIIANVLARLGGYSYSVYLVHFPIIVLYLSEPFGGTILYVLNFTDFLIIFTLIAILSLLLHKTVETRDFNAGISKLSVISASIILVLAAALPLAKNSFVSEQEIKIFGAFKDRSEYRCGKLNRILDPKAISCELVRGRVGSGAILLVGNSHADSIKTSFSEVARRNEITTYFLVKNNPMMAGGVTPEQIVNESRLKGVNHIVVHFSPEGIDTKRLSELVVLSGKNGIHVSFIDPVSTWTEHVPKEMYFQLKGGKARLHQTKEQYLLAHEILFREVNEISSLNFDRVPVVDYFCTPYCMFQNKDGYPLYFDRGHLTLTGGGGAGTSV